MKSLKTITVISFLLLLSIKLSNACTCEYGKTPFCPSATVGNHIIQAVVTDTPNFYSIEVEVIENINQVISENEILILGQDGLNCGESMDLFEIGDSLVLALFNVQINDAINDETYDWILDGCGVNYLEYSNGSVFGAIDYNDDSRSYEDFKAGLIDCLTLSVSAKNVIQEDITVYPNPTSERLVINSNTNTLHSIEIYSTQGLLMDKPNPNRKGISTIDVSTLQNGMYLIKVETDNSYFIKRIVKN